MAVFVYQGRSANGMQNGEIEAPDRSAAVGELRRRAILVTKIAEKSAPRVTFKFGGKVSDKEMAIFTRQFSTMIDAGLPLVQCLNILAEQSDSKTLRSVTEPGGSQRRGRVHTGRRVATAPAHLRRSLHQPRRGRGSGRYPRCRPAASLRLHREGGGPEAEGQGRDGVPERDHRRGHHGRHLHADLRDPDVRPDVQGPRGRPAPADQGGPLALQLRPHLHPADHRAA